MIGECTVERCREPLGIGLGWTVCDHHAAQVAADLLAVPDLNVELEHNLAREGVSGPRIGSRGSTRPLMFDSASSEALYVMQTTLASWVLELVMSSRDASGPVEARPVAMLPSMADWLHGQLHRLLARPEAGEFVAELDAAVTNAESTLDRVRERVFVGRCGTSVEWAPGQNVVCDVALYVKPGETWAKCSRCESQTLVQQRLEQLRESLEHRLLTVRQIAVCVAWLGEFEDTRRTENRLYKWAEREVIEDVACSLRERRPLYPFGEVLKALRARR